VNETWRERLKEAVQVLNDGEFQERLWVRGERRNNDEPTFDDVVLLILDELDWPTTAELIGPVLRDKAELDAFVRLSTALDKLAIGDRLPFPKATSHSELWHECQLAADELRALLDRP